MLREYFFECILNKLFVFLAVGNMGHLIVEACIARRLIDSSAYLWPGYVGGLVNPLSHSIPVQGSPWSAFMEGSPLSISLISALIATPASRYFHVSLQLHTKFSFTVRSLPRT